MNATEFLQNCEHSVGGTLSLGVGKHGLAGLYAATYFFLSHCR